MGAETREYPSLDEHADITCRNALQWLKSVEASFPDVTEVRVVGNTVVCRVGPTTHHPDIPRRRVTISVAVKVEEE
jgi:hypothetical protein